MIRTYVIRGVPVTAVDIRNRLRTLAAIHGADQAALSAVVDGWRTDTPVPLTPFALAVSVELPDLDDLRYPGEWIDLVRDVSDVIAGRALIIERGAEPLLEPSGDGPDVWRCRLCGSPDVQAGAVPSMYAGLDPWERCPSCHAYTTTNPFTGDVTVWQHVP